MHSSANCSPAVLLLTVVHSRRLVKTKSTFAKRSSSGVIECQCTGRGRG